MAGQRPGPQNTNAVPGVPAGNQEIDSSTAAYIVGYMDAQYKKGAPGVQGNPDYCISHMEAKDWAEIFLMRKYMSKYATLSAFIEEMIEERIQSEW